MLAEKQNQEAQNVSILEILKTTDSYTLNQQLYELIESIYLDIHSKYEKSPHSTLEYINRNATILIDRNEIIITNTRKDGVRQYCINRYDSINKKPVYTITKFKSNIQTDSLTLSCNPRDTKHKKRVRLIESSLSHGLENFRKDTKSLLSEIFNIHHPINARQ